MAFTRAQQPMPGFVAEALDQMDLRDGYDARPPCQRNDCLGWINRAKKDEPKKKRLRQMLAELEAGEGYMNMPWHPGG